MFNEFISTDGTTESTPPTKSDYRVRHDWNGTTALSTTILRAVAGAAGVTPVDLVDDGYPPLYDVIDVDALDEVFVPGSGVRPLTGADGASLTFRYAGYRIEVRSDGVVTAYGDD